MATKSIYSQLGFNNLYDVGKSDDHIDVSEFDRIGIDKVYFSGDYPAIFFKAVISFDEETLKTIAEIQHLMWNYRKVMFLFVSSQTEVRIYNCNDKPFNYTKPGISFEKELKNYELLREDINALKVVNEIFSKIAVDSGVLWNTENKLREKINIQNRIDKFLIKSLLNVAKELKKLGLTEDIIHCLLMRSIFIMYLEDKGAARDTNLYSEIDKNANSYFDILNNVTATYKLFDKLEVHFNGNVFPIIDGEQKLVTQKHLEIIRKCLFDGDLSDNLKLFEWRLFRFDIIQIELLSEIYEHFLEEFKAIRKEEAGQYYTPPTLVDVVLNEKLKTDKASINYNVKVLDPACGSGIFLVESYKRLIKRWKNAHPGQVIEFAQLKEIIENNIFGIEYDKLAIRVTTFSLYLAIVEQLNPSTLWIDNSRKFPYLINDKEDQTLKKQGKNLFRADTIADIEPNQIPSMELVVGNPPFGSKTAKHKPTKDFCNKNKFGQDLVIPFLCKAVDFAPNGSVALIFNTKVLTNTEKPFQNFRRWLFNDTYVEKVYNLSIFRKALKSFGGQLFSSAVGPVSIVFYQKNKPNKVLKTIEYWAPKTYVKNSLVEGVVIDSSDIKFLPREECQKPSSKIWKVAMWGNMEDYLFINDLSTGNDLKKFISNKKLIKGLGLQFLDKSTKKPQPDKEIPKLPYVLPNAIKRFHTPTDSFFKIIKGITDKSLKIYSEYYDVPLNKPLNKIDVFRRLGKKEAYIGPHVLIKEGLSNKKLCASFIPESCSFNSKVLGISGSNTKALKAITAIVNSDLATYFLFLISASIGIEREEIKPNEIYKIPFELSQEDINELASYVDKIAKAIKSSYPMEPDFSEFERQLNEKIFDIYKLTEQQRFLVKDFLKYNSDLIFTGHKSVALKPALSTELKVYANALRTELRSFLGTSEKVSVETYNISMFQPLNMIKIMFGKSNEVVYNSSNDEFNAQLTDIDKYLLKKEGKNIYIKKQYKYFNNNTIYLVKPNQKRFWSYSNAMNDARDLIAEIINMK